MALPYKKGSSGAEIKAWQQWAYKAFSGYASLIGPIDSYYGIGEENFVKEMQRRLGIPITGVFDSQTSLLVGYHAGVDTPTPITVKRRKIWIYSSPGSGADWNVGPSFELGEMCKDILKLNHQPVGFQKGGYLGLLGGDAGYSYNEVIWDQCKSIEYLLDNNPDAKEAMDRALDLPVMRGRDPQTVTDDELRQIAPLLEFECHFSGYSQSADGTEEALEYLFGDAGRIHPGDKTETPSTGKYRILRHCVKLVVQFGNPSTKGTGIARKTRSDWLDKKIRNVNKTDDFYAVVPQSDKIRPAFYAVVVEAETELPFFAHVLRIAVPIIVQYAPVLGFFGPLGQIAVAALAGLQAGMPLLTAMMGYAGSDKDDKIDVDLVNILKPTGILTNIPGLIQLVGQLPGLQHHGEYFQDDIQTAYNHIAAFRR